MQRASAAPNSALADADLVFLESAGGVQASSCTVAGL